jgi:hypothetical protein
VRAFALFFSIALATFAGCSRAERLDIAAPVSAEDVRQISAVVGAATTQPITLIGEVTTEAYIPGVTPRVSTTISANGERHENIMYRVLIGFGFSHAPLVGRSCGSMSRRRTVNGSSQNSKASVLRET